MRRVCQKLVRDRIPELIRSKGGVPETRVLDDHEFRAELRKKFQEELDEYLTAETSAKQLEEMADIFEVITALNEAEGRSLEAVIEAQKEKRENAALSKTKSSSKPWKNDEKGFNDLSLESR